MSWSSFPLSLLFGRLEERFGAAALAKAEGVYIVLQSFQSTVMFVRGMTGAGYVEALPLRRQKSLLRFFQLIRYLVLSWTKSFVVAFDTFSLQIVFFYYTKVSFLCRFVSDLISFQVLFFSYY